MTNDEFVAFANHCYAAIRWGHIEANPTTVVRYFAEDAMLLPPDDQPIVGRQEISRFLSEWYRQVQVVDVSHRIREAFIAGTIAYDIAEYRLAYRTSAGSMLIEDGFHLVIWRFTVSDSWLIIRDMATVVRRSPGTES